MEPAEIRAFLRSVPHAGMIQVPPGNVAILQARLTSARDPAAVREWIFANGGDEDSTVLPPSQGLRPGRHMQPASEVVPYYIVPKAAIEEPDSS